VFVGLVLLINLVVILVISTPKAKLLRNFFEYHMSTTHLSCLA